MHRILDRDPPLKYRSKLNLVAIAQSLAAAVI